MTTGAHAHAGADIELNRSGFTGAQAQQTIRTILDSAREVFRDRGYSRTSMNDIAATAGISRASVYTYFQSKRAILIALGVANNRAYHELVAEFAAARCVRPMVVGWVGRYLDFLDADQSFTYVWHEAARDDEVLRAESTTSYRRAWRVIGDALDAGELHGMVVVGAIEHTWFFWRHLGTELTRDQVVESLLPLVS